MTEPPTAENATGKVSKAFYDALRRQIAVVENFQNESGFSIGWAAGRWVVDDPTLVADQDRVTSRVYKIAESQQTWLVAHSGTADDANPEITNYFYGASIDGSTLSNDLLAEIVYPDGAQTSDSVLFTYNRLAEVHTTIDQNETVHTYTRDPMGRLLTDAADSGSGIDDTVDSIVIDYDDFGRPISIESKDESTVVNAVEMSYTALWQLMHLDQDPDSATNASGGVPTERVTYAYSSAAVSSGNYSRLESITYPDESVVEVLYGGSSTSDVSSGIVARGG